LLLYSGALASIPDPAMPQVQTAVSSEGRSNSGPNEFKVKYVVDLSVGKREILHNTNLAGIVRPATSGELENRPLKISQTYEEDSRLAFPS
jgi:hypothetical protein